MSASAFVVRFELEAAPTVYVDATDEGELAHLEDWLDRHPSQRELIVAALRLASESRAA